jgi:tetratricopeptide (TPR) repeat protein
MIKKLSFLVMTVSILTVAKAQNPKVVSAFNYLRNNNLEKAKINIDEASVHEATINKAKTWLYKGNVYYMIAISKDPKIVNLDTNALEVALVSFKKSFELDKAKEYEKEIYNGINNCSIEYFKKGVSNFQNNNLNLALVNFEKSYNIAKEVGRIDTSALLNAAIAAEATKSPKAKQFYSSLVDMNYNKASIYKSLSDIYKTEDKDTAKALEIVQKGRKLFPDDYKLLIAETNIFMQTKRKKEAENNLKLAIQKDPNNPVLYNVIGNSYQDNNNFEEAEKAYKKSIELNPKYFDALFNLGALYFNDGVRIFEAADKISDQKLYEVEKEKFEKRFKESIPWLEKALEINPNDQYTISQLKQLYSRTGQMDKLKELNEKTKQK